MFIGQQKQDDAHRKIKKEKEIPSKQLTEDQKQHITNIRMAGLNHTLPSGNTSMQAKPKESGTIQAMVEEEEELPAQGKFEKTIQKQELEDEELLQGKFYETIQKQELEDEELLQGKFNNIIQKQTPEDEELIQGKTTNQAPNNTGMPNNLKSGIENLSGLDMSNVRVHSNSSKPKNVGAHAYTQGTDIHLAPGQEKHLPHEAWHVVQQMQGRVQPTTEVSGVPVNDDVSLENEADEFGAGVMQRKASRDINLSVCQREKIKIKASTDGYKTDGAYNELKRIVDKNISDVEEQDMEDNIKRLKNSILNREKEFLSDSGHQNRIDQEIELLTRLETAYEPIKKRKKQELKKLLKEKKKKRKKQKNKNPFATPDLDINSIF